MTPLHSTYRKACIAHVHVINVVTRRTKQNGTQRHQAEEGELHHNTCRELKTVQETSLFHVSYLPTTHRKLSYKVCKPTKP